MKKPTDGKPTTERITQIESDLRDHKYKNADDYARVLSVVGQSNQDLIKDKFISECIPQAALLYDTYRDAARLLYLPKNDQLRKDKLLTHYDENRQYYPFVLREMIEGEDLYKLTGKQERRDFIVKLVIKMLGYLQPGMGCKVEVLREKIQKSN